MGVREATGQGRIDGSEGRHWRLGNGVTVLIVVEAVAVVVAAAGAIAAAFANAAIVIVGLC